MEEQINNEVKKPNLWKRLRWWQKAIIIVIALAIVSAIFGLGGNGKNKTKKVNASPIVSIVKSGYFDGYDKYTVGALFNYFFSNPDWSLVKDGNDFQVSFGGGASMNDESVKIIMYFDVDKEAETFTVSKVYMDGEEQESSVVFDWVEGIYVDYEQYLSDMKSNSKNTNNTRRKSIFKKRKH